MISLTSPVRLAAHGWAAGAKALAALCIATMGCFRPRPIPALQARHLALTLLAYALPGWRLFQVRTVAAAGVVAYRRLLDIALWLTHQFTNDVHGARDN